ncbi:MAG: hypothetical protein ACM3QV_00235 [Caulobacteraceae bacterium]
MKLKFTWWSAVIGILLLAMILSILGVIKVDAISIFWIVVTVACVWAMIRLVFTKR